MGWTKKRVNDHGKIRYQAWWRDHRGHATEPIALQTRTPASSAATGDGIGAAPRRGRPARLAGYQSPVFLARVWRLSAVLSFASLARHQLPLLVGSSVGGPLHDLCSVAGRAAVHVRDQSAVVADDGVVTVAGGLQVPLLVGAAVAGPLLQLQSRG